LYKNIVRIWKNIFKNPFTKARKCAIIIPETEMEGAMDYISRIKKLKTEKKITNDKLSELTGIPLGTLSKILAGISDSPKLSNMVLIAEALGCSLDYIVSGTPENTNNYTLSIEEIAFIEDYRQLDNHGRELLSLVAQKELDRVGIFSEPAAKTAKKNKKTSDAAPKRTAKILPSPAIDTTKVVSSEFGRMTVLLYDLPVSAGPGVYLDDSIAETISIPSNEKTSSTDYALRISGNSMEPKYHDGDIVLVEDTDSVEIGELGIFVLDGNGYFKKFGGDRLISLNEEYGDILLRDYAEAVCCGRVIGKLKRK
jgi:SOS-response transcriptional repressor LexA/DNA-binding Xre family transcriptional regulator